MTDEYNDRYAIQSKITGKYLSALFADNHNETYDSEILKIGECYFWGNRDIAERIARGNNGQVIICKFKGNQFLYSAKLD